MFFFVICDFTDIKHNPTDFSSSQTTLLRVPSRQPSCRFYLIMARTVTVIGGTGIHGVHIVPERGRPVQRMAMNCPELKPAMKIIEKFVNDREEMWMKEVLTRRQQFSK